MYYTVAFSGFQPLVGKHALAKYFLGTYNISVPELPEVETIRLGLQRFLVGHIIEQVEVRMPKQITGDTSLVIGAMITRVDRFGKGLVIQLSNGYALAIHIKMTGQLIYRGANLTRKPKFSSKVGNLPGTATHVIFHFDKNSVLYYNDTRQFGWIQIVKAEEVGELPFFKSLGPEVFKELTVALFIKILSTSKGPIKPVLLDQKKMAGIGNIYANDALYRAGIHPKRPASSLTEAEARKLFAAIEEVMQKGLEVGGSSEWAYVNALGEEGSYQKIFLVYNKVGLPCPQCGTIIEKITLGGRGTFYCPRCQE